MKWPWVDIEENQVPSGTEILPGAPSPSRGALLHHCEVLSLSFPGRKRSLAAGQQRARCCGSARPALRADLSEQYSRSQTDLVAVCITRARCWNGWITHDELCVDMNKEEFARDDPLGCWLRREGCGLMKRKMFWGLAEVGRAPSRGGGQRSVSPAHRRGVGVRVPRARRASAPLGQSRLGSDPFWSDPIRSGLCCPWPQRAGWGHVREGGEERSACVF
jgi:hypothetical protein